MSDAARFWTQDGLTMVVEPHVHGAVAEVYGGPFAVCAMRRELGRTVWAAIEAAALWAVDAFGLAVETP